MIASLVGPPCLHYICTALCAQPPHRSRNETGGNGVVLMFYVRCRNGTLQLRLVRFRSDRRIGGGIAVRILLFKESGVLSVCVLR